MTNPGDKNTIRVLAFPAFKNKTSNPYNYLLYENLKQFNIEVLEFSFVKALRLKYDLVHIHWPERYLNGNSLVKAAIGSLLLLLTLSWSKLNDKKIVWTVHNLEPHKVKFATLNTVFWRAYLRLVDASISLSEANLQLCFEKFPRLKRLPSTVTYHGLYENIYPNTATKDSARQELGIEKNEKVCLFLGRVMRYKNIDILINLFLGETPSNVKLVIAGRIDDESYHKELREQIGESKNILMREGFVRDSDLQIYMNAADVMVLPFDKIFNSGSALLGVSFNVKVLIPYSKNFEEYQKITSGCLACYKGDLTAEHIAHALTQNEQEKSKNANELDWKEISKSTRNFFESLINRRDKRDSTNNRMTTQSRKNSHQQDSR